MKKVIHLLIPNGQGRHYFAVKKLPALLRPITLTNNGHFHCLVCLHSSRTNNKCESHKRVCGNKDFCKVVMLSEDSKILEFNQYQKSDKAPFIIYAYPECLIETIEGCKNNPEICSTTKVSEHISSGFPIFLILPFKSIENNHYADRGKDYRKKFFGSLREQEMGIINFKMKKMKLLIKE